MSLLAVTVARPWATVGLPDDWPVLSFAPSGGGDRVANRVLWREVRDDDLGPEVDVDAWLAAELAAVGQAGAVAMLTSRNVESLVHRGAVVGGVRAECVATVGLSNAERVGRRRHRGGGPGTINLCVAVEAGMSFAARLEAMTIAAEARTLAVLDAGLEVPGGAATGTGTDCIVVAAPIGPVVHAGLHTEIGEAVGRAVLDAVSAGVAEWRAGPGARFF